MAQEKTDMDKLLWIVDSWVSTDGESKSYEEWKKTDDNLYEGGSKTVKNGDIIFMESLRIERTSEGIFYVADVKHNPKPVRFKLTDVSDTLAVFENPEHDFPKKITYMNENGNLHAFIEGPGKDGKDKKIDFFLTKMR
ncbi:MAG: DUF6265 family protein [Ignavibacteria bacterium]